MDVDVSELAVVRDGLVFAVLDGRRKSFSRLLTKSPIVPALVRGDRLPQFPHPRT